MLFLLYKLFKTQTLTKNIWLISAFCCQRFRWHFVKHYKLNRLLTEREQALLTFEFNSYLARCVLFVNSYAEEIKCKQLKFKPEFF